MNNLKLSLNPSESIFKGNLYFLVWVCRIWACYRLRCDFLIPALAPINKAGARDSGFEPCLQHMVAWTARAGFFESWSRPGKKNITSALLGFIIGQVVELKVVLMSRPGKKRLTVSFCLQEGLSNKQNRPYNTRDAMKNVYLGILIHTQNKRLMPIS